MKTAALKVHYEWLYKLQPVIEAAQRECAEKRDSRT